MIIKWVVTNWNDALKRKEYSRETEHFYMHASGRGRDSKISRYECYFDSETDALKFINKRQASRIRSKEIDQIKRHAVELLEALVVLQAAAYNIGGEHITDYAPLIAAADAADEIIAKAKGLTK